MIETELDQFLRFAQKYRGKFKRIAAATRREHQPDDVLHEAWVMSKDWELGGTPIRFEDPEYVNKLFSYVYNKLVKYTEKKIRTATRLDHWTYGDNPDSDSHPLMNSLAAAGPQPLEALLAAEELAQKPAEPGPHATRASAYLHLVRHYNNCMQDVASHLLISTSYCYYRLNEAREMQSRQYVLPDTVENRLNNDFMPGPWRSFKLAQRHVETIVNPPPSYDLWD